MARETRPDSSRVSAALPLALLEALHAHDRPREVPPVERPDSDHALPLGLTDVVHAQIRLYRRLGARRRVRSGDVQDLFRLIARRPDAAAIFEEAGRLLARLTLPRPLLRRIVLGALPGKVRWRAALRHVRTVAPGLVAATGLTVLDKPLLLEIEDGLAARAAAPEACRLYTAFLEDTLSAHTGSRWRARHEACQALGHARCVWTAEEEARDGVSAQRT